jgi:hypothetical protein
VGALGIAFGFFGISFGIGPFRFGASTGGGGGGGGDFTDGESDFFKLCLIGIGASSASAGFGWLINETVGGFNFLYYLVCPALLWTTAVWFVYLLKSEEFSFFKGLVIGLPSPLTFIIAMRQVPLVDRKLWNLSGPEKQELYGSSLADLAPFWIWLTVIGGGFLLIPLMLFMLKRIRKWLLQKKHDKNLMLAHQQAVEQRGITSVNELRLHLAAEEKSNREARERDAEVRMKAQAVQMKAQAVQREREAELLRLRRASNLASKEMYHAILDELHDKVKVKLNPDVGEAITQAEMVEAFQHAGHRVNAATELIDEHRSAAWKQIGKLTQLLRDEAGWEVLAPTPPGP